MKAPIDNLINKDLFIKLRNTFPYQYRYACEFYNSNTTKDIIFYSSKVINKLSKELIKEISNSNNIVNLDIQSTIQNQYQSMYKCIDDSFENIDNQTLNNIIENISDIDKSTLTIRMIVKGLILLQISYNLKDIIFSTIENNNKYNFLTEHKTLYIEEILKHIYENQNYHIITELVDHYKDNDKEEERIIKNLNRNITKKFNTLLESDNDNDEIEFTEEDLFEDDYYSSINIDDNESDKNEISYNTDNIDEYIQRLYKKIAFLLKESVYKIIDIDYKYLPNLDILIYYIIILMMLYIQRY